MPGANTCMISNTAKEFRSINIFLTSFVTLIITSGCVGQYNYPSVLKVSIKRLMALPYSYFICNKSIDMYPILYLIDVTIYHSQSSSPACQGLWIAYLLADVFIVKTKRFQYGSKLWA